ncbi:MAG: tRNA (N(6)-L-threonylcarbamoyladenosine(37)-C(2))-methylthiotransferase [Candidatus Aenigmatarchaeota archaeon]
MKVYLETYGCAANQAHSEVMKGLLSRAGGQVVENEDIADMLILNSCIVKSPTENRIIHRLKEWKEEYPNKEMIIAGCMPQAEYDRTVEFAPHASLVGPNNCRDIAKAVRKTMEGERVEYLDGRREEKLCLPRIRGNDLIDICEIAQGCPGNCSYCQVKFAKGGLKSYDPDKIVKEVSQSLNVGCREVWITAQDTASYGRDIGTSLPELLEKITKLSGNFRVRVGMMNVNTLKPILDELIEVYKSEKIYSFLHLPLQSGSDKILEKMNRKYTVEEWKKVVKRFRKEVPELNLWTDVIVGFPGETGEEFKDTKEVLKDLRPEHTNVSRFGARPGTEAKEMEQLDTEVKKSRSEELSELVKKISKEEKGNLVEEKRKVLVLGKEEGKNQWKGRDTSYRPVVLDSKEDLKGKFVTVVVEDFGETYLRAKK